MAAFNRLTRVTVSEEVTVELACVKRNPHRDQGKKKKKKTGRGISNSKSSEVEKGFAYSENRKTSVPGDLGRKEWSQTGK